MIPLTIPPVCLVPNCQNGRQILSKEGGSTRYMLTCRSHHTGLILKKETKTA
jgi:hypothetical protein